MTLRIAVPLLFVVALLCVATQRVQAAVTAERSEKGVEVKIDGKLFTEYLVDCKGTPALWPIVGPTGKPMTRAYPMGQGPNEKKDHPHHRSMWFTHGNVNGLSFWHRETIKHREFVKVESGNTATVVTRNDWLAPDGSKVCEDQRSLRFGGDGDSRWIDFDITVKADAKPVKFGDTKEGTFGIRVAGPMKIKAGKGGQIVNSDGLEGKSAWGKAAAWVDFNGPLDADDAGDKSKTVGIAVFNHPDSFRFPTYWHVRDYGLFAANPFGLHDFKGDRKADGSHTLKPGESMTLRYRVFMHKGDEKAGKVAEAFAAYAKEKK